MIVKLGSLISEYSVRNKADEDIPVYSVTNEQGFCTGYFSKEVASQDRTTYKIVPRGCFAYNPSRINVGSVDVQECEDRVIVSPLYVVFSVDEKLNRRYLLHYLKSDITLTYIKAYASGSVRDNLKFSILKDFPINLPSAEEQGQIVATLDGIEHLIALRKEEIASLDELVKSRFIEMFEDPVTNPLRWAMLPLEKCLTVLGGYAFKSEEFKTSGVPVLRIGNINTGAFTPTNMVYWSKDDCLTRYQVLPGDLVISLTGTVGKDDYGNVCILGNAYPMYYLNQRNAKLILDDELNKHYLSELLKFSQIKKKLTGISRGVRQANISNRDILNLVVPIPPIEIQVQFAAFVEQVDKSKLAVQNALEELEILKKSLMKQYFG